ncbi:MAG: hypothetical protein QM730_02300 [Anaerolineales bacterium]
MTNSTYGHASNAATGSCFVWDLHRRAYSRRWSVGLAQADLPLDLNPDSSIIFGCIFLGDAFYFLYGLLRPNWGNACGQLLSFLAYDLVLIVPFVLLINTVKPGHMLNLIVYIAVLVYSGGLAVYYLFVHPQTRFGSAR